MQIGNRRLDFAQTSRVKVDFLLVDGTEKEGDAVNGTGRPFTRDTWIERQRGGREETQTIQQTKKTF